MANKPYKLIVDIKNGNAHRGATQLTEIRGSITRDPSVQGFLNMVEDLEYVDLANVNRARLVQGDRVVQDVVFRN